MRKTKKNAFTLIELLAVIVILAIIALIAVPTIMDLVEESIKKSVVNSIQGLIRAGNLYYSKKEMIGEELEEVIFEFPNDIEGLQIEGQIPDAGIMKITEEGKITLAVTKGKYCLTKGYRDAEVEVTEEVENCILPVTLSDVATISEELEITEINECVTGKKCESGTEFAIKVNKDEVYKFYVIEDKGTEITLIMNKNLDKTSAWFAGEAENSNGPKTILNSLVEQTSNWTNIPERIYIIEDDKPDLEVVNVTPKYEAISIKSRTRLLTLGEASKLGCSDKCPTYLYENTANQYCYWTSTARTYIYLNAWCITKDGYPSKLIYVTNSAGVRPVITLYK